MFYIRAKLHMNMVYNRVICFCTTVSIILGGTLNMVMLTTIGNRDDIILQIMQSYLKKYAMLDIFVYSYILC